MLGEIGCRTFTVYIADPLQKVYGQEPLRKTQEFWFDGGSYVNESPLADRSNSTEPNSKFM
jgi:hypothetical protein